MDARAISQRLSEDREKSLVLRDILQILERDEKMATAMWSIDEMVFVLLQVITDSFYVLNTESFTEERSKDVRTCIDILRIMIDVPEIRCFFLDSQIDYYIYPFLMVSTDEQLRLSTLGLFSTLLRKGLPESMRGSELLPLLLKIVDSNSEMCQILALQTLELLLVDTGLDYAVQTIDRFQAIDVVLSALVTRAVFRGNSVLVKILLKIYCRLCDRNNVRQKLKEKMPEGLDSKEALKMCEEDAELCELRCRLLKTLQ